MTEQLKFELTHPRHKLSSDEIGLLRQKLRLLHPGDSLTGELCDSYVGIEEKMKGNKGYMAAVCTAFSYRYFEGVRGHQSELIPEVGLVMAVTEQISDDSLELIEVDNSKALIIPTLRHSVITFAKLGQRGYFQPQTITDHEGGIPIAGRNLDLAELNLLNRASHGELIIGGEPLPMTAKEISLPAVISKCDEIIYYRPAIAIGEVEVSRLIGANHLNYATPRYPHPVDY